MAQTAPSIRTFGSIFSGKKVLLTGHTGFKGAWLAFWLKQLGAKVYGYALTEPGTPAAYTALGVSKLLSAEVIADLNDEAKLSEFYQSVSPDLVFHMAAQALVRQSYKNPMETIRSNILGTAQILDVVRLSRRPCAVVVITSDKCYQNREWVHGYREEDPMGGKDIYSMSKGACELVVAAYRNSFLSAQGVALASARAGNVIGGGDFAEARVIPDCVRAIEKNEPVLLRNPAATRPWQHVLEPLSGYLTLASRLLGPDAAGYCEGWNFGPLPCQPVTVREIVELFSKVCGKNLKIETEASLDVKSPKLHEAHSLSLSIDKALARLNWKPVWSAWEAIVYTAEWYARFDRRSPYAAGSMQKFTLEQIDQYSKNSPEGSAK
jgi:CDP-glucose 4,6-dehydratase